MPFTSKTSLTTFVRTTVSAAALFAVLFAWTGPASSGPKEIGGEWAVNCILDGKSGTNEEGAICCNNKNIACDRACYTKYRGKPGLVACYNRCRDARNECTNILGGGVFKQPPDKVRKPNAGTFQGNQSLMPVKPKFRKPYGGTFQGKQKLR